MAFVMHGRQGVYTEGQILAELEVLSDDGSVYMAGDGLWCPSFPGRSKRTITDLPARRLAINSSLKGGREG